VKPQKAAEEGEAQGADPTLAQRAALRSPARVSFWNNEA